MKHFFNFTNHVLREIWIQLFELLPIMREQQNFLDRNFNGRYPS